MAESCISGPELLGAVIGLESDLRKDALLFGESHSRIVISFASDQREEIEAGARRSEVEFTVLGEVGGSRFQVAINHEVTIDQDVRMLADIWKQALTRYGKRLD